MICADADLSRVDLRYNQAVHDQVLIRRVESEGKTAGGIIIPDTAKEEADGGQSNGRWSGRPQQG
jgi:hypothetical protein